MKIFETFSKENILFLEKAKLLRQLIKFYVIDKELSNVKLDNDKVESQIEFFRNNNNLNSEDQFSKFLNSNNLQTRFSFILPREIIVFFIIFNVFGNF